MKNLYLLTDTIRDRVSALEAGKALGLNVNRHGRCQCPIHHGTDANMSLSDKDRGFYCFVCKASGDVIHLVRAVNQCGFRDAVEWLNLTFKLGLPLDEQIDQEALKNAEIAKKQRFLANQMRKAIDAELFETYLNAGDVVMELERWKEEYRPIRWDEEWDERFVLALKLLPEARELATEAGMEVIKKP